MDGGFSVDFSSPMREQGLDKDNYEVLTVRGFNFMEHSKLKNDLIAIHVYLLSSNPPEKCSAPFSRLAI